jgi:hypothetical protein
MRLFVIVASATLVVGSAYAQVPRPALWETGASASVPAAILRMPVADRVPNFDVKKACREASIGVDACVTDEEAARKILTDQWSSFPARDKASCAVELRTVDRSASYVDLLSCLQIDADNRKPLNPGATSKSTSKSKARGSETGK